MTVRELIIKLLEYEMDAQVQIAKQGELHDIIDAWVRKGDIVILEVEYKGIVGGIDGETNKEVD